MAGKGHKRLIVACDGTWVNSDNGYVRDSWLPWNKTGHLANSSNVTRLCRALRSKSDDGIQQVVYYQGGLGSQNNFWSYFFGGYFGEGIGENIREAYSFLCNNYEDGDEIILVGFSRGAFTARSIGGLISSIGLLTKHGLGAFYPIFKDWEHQADPKYEPEFATATWPKERPKFRSPRYLEDLTSKRLTRPTIPIKAIGVWDTVGSLGIPTMKLFGIPLHTDTVVELSFINTEVAANIEYAYQALALDEKRTPFEPTIWESPDPAKSTLKLMKQTWFPGVHTNIGGGYTDTSIADITLAWMITQLSRHLTFDTSYITLQREQNEDFYRRVKSDVKAWAMGLIQDSSTGFLNTLTGRSTRTPGEYHPTDPDTGKPLLRKMAKTCEFIHPSVRYRIEQHGAGLAESSNDKIGKGEYHPTALEDWNFEKAGSKGAEVGGKKWEHYGKWVVDRPDGSQTFIVEENIEEGTAEMELLKGWKNYGVQDKLYPELVTI